jgi:FeS assembly SUF system protein
MANEEQVQTTAVDPNELKPRVIEALRTIFDPEIPVNIYDLGLVYDIEISPQGEVLIRMTLTAPGCPVAQSFPGTVESEVMQVPGVTQAAVDLVWDPPWNPDLMSEAARLQLGFF